MKKYVNNNHRMVHIVFEDGSTQYLRRGESISTEKKVKRMPEGVSVHDVLKNTRKVRKKAKD